MKMHFLKKRKLHITFIIALVGVLAAAAWANARTATAPPSSSARLQTASVSQQTDNQDIWSKAIFNVTNISCGGCVDTIQKAVAGLPGIGTVRVDLNSATAAALYDSRLMQDPQAIARAITSSGYPATLKTIITSEQLQQEAAESAALEKRYIASVGHLNIARRDYRIELGHARSRYEQIYGADTFSSTSGKALLQRLELQIARRMVDEAIKHQEVDRAGYSIEQDKVDEAMQAYLEQRKITLEQLKADLVKNDYPFDYFKQKFDQRVRLKHYLEDIVFAGSVDPDDREQRYSNWLVNARTLAAVKYYDKGLDALAASSAAGSCGGSGSCSGGGCSAAR